MLLFFALPDMFQCRALSSSSESHMQVLVDDKTCWWTKSHNKPYYNQKTEIDLLVFVFWWITRFACSSSGSLWLRFTSTWALAVHRSSIGYVWAPWDCVNENCKLTERSPLPRPSADNYATAYPLKVISSSPGYLHCWRESLSTTSPWQLIIITLSSTQLFPWLLM